MTAIIHPLDYSFNELPIFLLLISFYSIHGWIFFMPLQLNKLNDFATTNTNQFYLIQFSFSLFLSCMILFLNPAYGRVLDNNLVENSKFQANDLYQALSAEIYNKLGNQNQAVDFYYELTVNNNDPAIAKRVTELATVTGQIAKALDGSKRWVTLSPNSLEANQYLALLYIRNSHFTSAAKQLDTIRSLIERTSDNATTTLKSYDSKNNQFHSNESLTFIGALLSAEAHHEKAFTVFNLYLKIHAFKIKNHNIYDKQKSLIAAQLAMKAKKYLEVVDYLETLKGLDAQNYVDAKVMLAKALHKLHQNNRAIKYLKLIQNHPEANDSHRLELVRLLVLEKQKSDALPILEFLVTKHSKNFELLKSLVALQIDQSKLRNIDKNINKLRANSNYVNEADYFSGEFAEKLGQQEKALISYSNVKDGSYLKNAHKKRISLIKTIEGQKALKSFFEKQQNNADTIKGQSYWIKLQADDLFEALQYKDALNLYNRAITLTPQNSKYRYKRGLVYERLGNLEKAESDFSFVLEIHENDVDVLNALGYMLSVHTKRYREAKTYIDKAYKLKPNDPLILDSLGFVLYKTGELDKAEKYLRKAFSLMKKPEVASHLITVLAELKQHKEAKTIYLEMQKIYPNSPSLKSVLHYFP